MFLLPLKHKLLFEQFQIVLENRIRSQTNLSATPCMYDCVKVLMNVGAAFDTNEKRMETRSELGSKNPKVNKCFLHYPHSTIFQVFKSSCYLHLKIVLDSHGHHSLSYFWKIQLLGHSAIKFFKKLLWLQGKKNEMGFKKHDFWMKL